MVQAPLPELIPDGYDVTATCQTLQLAQDGQVSYTLIGVFPRADQYGRNFDDYQVSCPSFRIEHRRGHLTVVKGLDMDGLMKLAQDDDEPDRLPYLFAVSTYTLLDLRTPGVVKMTSSSQENLSGQVYAVRSGDALQPLLFKNQANTVTYDPSSTVQVLRRKNSSGNEWGRMIWSPSTRTLILDPQGGLEN